MSPPYFVKPLIFATATLAIPPTQYSPLLVHTMAYGSATTRARTPATGTRTASSAMQQTGGNDNPTCAHKEPMLRLECKNGNNR